MSIYKIIVPGTKVDLEIEADSIEKNSSGSVILYGPLSDSGPATTPAIGVFPRETIAYQIESSPWQPKLNAIVEFITDIQTKINERAAELERAQERDPIKEDMIRQVVKDFNAYYAPILEIIEGKSQAGDNQTEVNE